MYERSLSTIYRISPYCTMSLKENDYKRRQAFRKIHKIFAGKIYVFHYTDVIHRLRQGAREAKYWPTRCQYLQECELWSLSSVTTPHDALHKETFHRTRSLFCSSTGAFFTTPE